jgi:hydrogenase maturation protein HypF
MIQAVVRLPRSGPSVMAVGAFLKASVCVTRGDEAFVSKPVGDLDTAEARMALQDTANGLCIELGVLPLCIAHDLHPDFPSTHFAQSLGVPTLAVQHHHAHAAVLAAEHGEDGPVLALCLDGFGLGPGNQSWGGEVLRVHGAAFERLGHLALLAQPGGDIAEREPWRMASAALHRMGRGDEIANRFASLPHADRMGLLVARGINCPPTSSAGRLFDAACGLLGIHPVAAFEGQAPMALEAMVTAPEVMAGGWTLGDGVLDLLPLLGALPGCTPEHGANLFHGTLAAALAEWATQAAEATGLSQIALGGGCFFNRGLTGLLVDHLTARGLSPLPCRAVLPGDQGLSLGQAWVAVQSGEN